MIITIGIIIMIGTNMILLIELSLPLTAQGYLRLLTLPGEAMNPIERLKQAGDVEQRLLVIG